jgi:hypothetical protein
MPLKIIIPSHNRADRVFAKNLLVDPILFVAESQREEYAKHNKDVEIVTHSDKLIGLIPKRNEIIKTFGDSFMVDDDVFAFRRMYVEEGESQQIKDPKIVTQKIFELYELAKMMDMKLYGFTKNPRPVHYRENKMFSLSQSITGCAYGVMKDIGFGWPLAFQLKEDLLISGLNKYYNRANLIDMRYVFIQKDTMKNPGGLSDIRTQKKERENIDLLKKYFGQSVQRKTEKKASFNVILKYRY